MPPNNTDVRPSSNSIMALNARAKTWILSLQSLLTCNSRFSLLYVSLSSFLSVHGMGQSFHHHRE